MHVPSTPNREELGVGGAVPVHVGHVVQPVVPLTWGGGASPALLEGRRLGGTLPSVGYECLQSRLAALGVVQPPGSAGPLEAPTRPALESLECLLASQLSLCHGCCSVTGLEEELDELVLNHLFHRHVLLVT